MPNYGGTSASIIGFDEMSTYSNIDVFGMINADTLRSSNHVGSIGQSYPSASYDDTPERDESIGWYPREDTSGYIRGNAQNSEGNNKMSVETVASVFGHRVNYPSIERHPLIVGTNLVGVEIELENMRESAPRFNYWTAKSDGSLRNSGIEYVCSSPWGGKDLYNAAIEIDTYLFNNSPDESWRCSTHVHIDVRDMTKEQIKRMILAYAVYERVLFKCSGWHRYKNNFCVALGFAQEQIATISRAWDSDNFFNQLVNNWDKYSAMNLLTMQSFGSIEFRISEPKWRKGRLIRLVNRFLSLKEVAVNFEGTENDFLEMLVSSPVGKILRKGLPRDMPDIESDVEMGFKLAHDIISLSKIKKRHIRKLLPDLNDGTRKFLTTDLFDNGWLHIKTLLGNIVTNVELPDVCPPEVNFSWLLELQNLCSMYDVTCQPDWFFPTQNRSQVMSLYSSYKSSQIGSEVEPVSFYDGEDEESDSEDDVDF